MMQEGYTHLAGNTGYMLLKVPQDILNEVKTSVDNIQSNFTQAIPVNNYLAGQIDKEYRTKLTNKTTQYIKHTVEQYCNLHPHYINTVYKHHQLRPNLKYGGDAWVNFQEKYEYNPIHNHSGIFSFVIWYQIPFYKENEIKYGAGKFKAKDQINKNGDFEFVYYNGEEIVGEILPIDKTMEGHMALFPSNLQHLVYPFYSSDDYRITISGNIYLK